MADQKKADEALKNSNGKIKNLNDELNVLKVGNSMRRVLEAFSTFVYKKGIADISCDNTILQQIRDKDYIDYFKNLMYRLVLNGDSHMLERTNNLDDMEISLDKNSRVETVVMLSHKKIDSVINVKVEFGEGEGKVPLDNIAKRAAAYKPKERVAYKMIKEYIEAKYGFKVHTAYIAEVKRDLGLPMYDAPNAVEELKQPRKHPTTEKVEAIKGALKYYKEI